MYYALVDMRSSCIALTALAWGSLNDIASMLISECDMLMENTDDMTMEELEEEYYCEFDDYKELVDCEEATFEMIANFSFTLGDCTTEVGCLVEGYSELVKAYKDYASDKMTLDEWRMIPEIEETDENLSELDEELRSLNDDLSRGDYKYFVEADYDEEEEADSEDE